MKRVKKGKRGKRGLKGKKVTAGIFQKESHFGEEVQKYPQNRVFWSFQILGFTWYTKIGFIILWKPHVLEKSGSWVISENTLNCEV